MHLESYLLTKRSGSGTQWYGSADLDLDPYQNSTDPHHRTLQESLIVGMNLLMHAELDAGDSYLRERLSLLSRGDKLWRSFSETRGGNKIKLLLSPK
jgi:hypothetical protein